MTLVVRPVRADDADALFRMAEGTGVGFTNLPADRPTLAGKIERAITAFARSDDTPADEVFLFVLEGTANAAVCGTCQIFSRIGSTWPFYSYRIGVLTQFSKELARTIRVETLTLCTDLDGATEVGGLFLDPAARSAGIGKLLARSRYLFMKLHRPRFADRTIAELRGALDADGSSPFWDGLAGRFFGMPFREADEFNAIHGNQFIADLMPRYPIYTALLPDAARAQIGRPHGSGEAAMRMLEREGFAFDSYVDIFDGGPTMIAETDRIATVREARSDRVSEIAGPGSGTPCLVGAGRLARFRCCHGKVSGVDGGVALDSEAAQALGVALGDTVIHVPD